MKLIHIINEVDVKIQKSKLSGAYFISFNIRECPQVLKLFNVEQLKIKVPYFNILHELKFNFNYHRYNDDNDLNIEYLENIKKWDKTLKDESSTIIINTYIEVYL